MGPSGSGKSTFLRTFNALEDYQEGRVVVDGMLLDEDLRHIDAIRREVGMVFQQFNLFPHLSVLDNLMLAPVQVRRRARAEVRTQALELLERVGIHAQADRFPGQLSGGQQQRVAIARALVLRPTVLLCDESVSMLDAEVQAEVLDLLRDLQQRLGLGMIFVTHDLGVASGFCHRVIVLDRGRIAEEGPGDVLLKAPMAPITRRLVDACPRLPPAA